MANTARASTTIKAYAQLNYKGHDPTKDQARISAQEWRDTITSLQQYACVTFDSTLTHASTGSTDIYRLAGISTSFPSVSSSDITVADSTAGVFTIGTAGDYLSVLSANIVGDGDITFTLHEISTAGSTAQGAGHKVHTLSTAEQPVSISQIVSVAAGNKLSFVWTATTAASTFLLTGSWSVVRVK